MALCKVATVLSALFLFGCATICNQDAHHTVYVRADADDVKVTVLNAGRQVDQFYAPRDFKLNSSRYGFCRAKYEFIFEKEGYHTERYYRDGEFCGWYVGNILFGGLIGLLIVDPLSGSMYSIDGRPIDVHMRRVQGDSGYKDFQGPLPFTMLSMSYDESSCKGVIKVGYPQGRYEDARKFVRRNIETIAKDKNIALETGAEPSTARYSIGNESIVEQGVLEVHFLVQ